MDPKLPQKQNPKPLDPSIIPPAPAPKPLSAVRPVGPSDGKDPIRLQKMMQAGGIGHPEMERPPTPQPAKAEQQANVEQVKKAFDKGPTVESQEQLNLKKEILPGVEEVHDHQDEPVELPSLLSDAGMTSGALPPGSMLYKDTHVTLPLTPVQMKQGLHTGVARSFRWLAEWCIKQLKEAHLVARQQARP